MNDVIRTERRPLRRRHLRVALPPLAQLHADTPCAFALIDRQQTVLRAGTLPLARIAQDVVAAPVYAVLAPQDGVVLNLSVPPVPARAVSAAVRFGLEPLVLSELDSVYIVHGSRDQSGQVCAAWIDRSTLNRVWALMGDVGLAVRAILPHAAVIPLDDGQPQQALQLPADARWTAPLPVWSFAQEGQRRAHTARPWRGVIALASLVALLWAGGFAAYATRQQQELHALKTAMESIVRATFPQIPVVIAPLQQASAARDALRLTHGLGGADNFLTHAQAAAQILEFAAGHVQSMVYADGALSLTLVEGYTPPADDAALAQSARRQSLELEKDGVVAHTWRIRRAPAPIVEGQQP